MHNSPCVQGMLRAWARRQRPEDPPEGSCWLLIGALLARFMPAEPTHFRSKTSLQAKVLLGHQAVTASRYPAPRGKVTGAAKGGVNRGRGQRLSRVRASDLQGRSLQPESDSLPRGVGGRGALAPVSAGALPTWGAWR